MDGLSRDRVAHGAASGAAVSAPSSANGCPPAGGPFIRQEEVIGKTVVAGDGRRLGTVKELAFSLGGRLGLVVAAPTPSAGEATIAFDEVQGVADFIVLRPQPAPPAGPPSWQPVAHPAPGAAATSPATGLAPQPATAAFDGTPRPFPPYATDRTRAATGPAPTGPATTVPESPAASCNACGSPLRPRARFCGRCGRGTA